MGRLGDMEPATGRHPGSTGQEILFQRRSWLSETPKRSAMETRVSPLRVV